jgi:hypothetical protein
MFELEVIGSPYARQTISAKKLVEAVQSNRGGVKVIDAVIEDAVDLSAVTFDHELILQACTFKGPLDARDARFGKSVDLTNCVFEQNLNFAGARIEGSLLLPNCEIRKGGDPSALQQPGQHDGPQASFALLRVGGNLVADALTSAVRVAFNGARITGDASFTAAGLTGGLGLEVAVVEGSLNCGRVRLRNGPPDPHGGQVQEGSALLGGIKVTGQINFRGALIERDLVLYSAEIHCGLRCGPDGPDRTKIGGDALLTAATVAFGAEFSEAQINGNLNFQDAEVDGDLLCQRTEILYKKGGDPEGGDGAGQEGGSALLAGASITGVADFRGAQIAHDLYLQSTVIRGGLYCRAFEVPPAPETPHGTRTSIGKNAWLAAATVQGGIDFSGASIGGELSLDGADVEGGLFCRPWRLHFNSVDALPTSSGGNALSATTVFVPTHIAGNALLAAAKISGVVDFSGARIDHNLNLESADIKNGMFCKPLNDHYTVIGGKALLTATKVSGVVDFSGAEIGEDLNMESAEINNGVSCRPHGERTTVVGGSVLLMGSKVSGGIDLRGTRIKNDFNLEGAHIDGKLNCSSPDGQQTELGGDAMLAGVKVAGGVNFTRMVLVNLNMQGAEIDGKLTCKHAQVAGKALLNDVQVSGQIDFDGARVGGDLVLQGARVDGKLSFLRTHAAGRVDLRACSVRNAELGFGEPEEAAGPHAKKPTWPALRIEGFAFQDLTMGEQEKGRARDYADLLRASETFDVSTYYLIERWLRNRGEEEQANKIYLAMRRERRKHSRAGSIYRVMDAFFDAPIFLALRFKLLFFVFVASLALTTTILLSEDACRLKAADATPVAWSPLDAFWMSVQLHLPMTHIPAVDRWELTSKPVQVAGVNCWLHYDYFGSFISLFGYVAVPLFVAGVANTWLRQKASGG